MTVHTFSASIAALSDDADGICASQTPAGGGATPTIIERVPS